MMIVNFLIGLVTGILSGFGIGGGSLLILYLTTFAGVPQYSAAGINLLYFLFCAPTALISHIRKHLVEKKTALIAIAAGVLTSLGAAYVASLIDLSLLRRIFGVFLLYIGIRELFCPKESEKKEEAGKKEK